MDFILENGNEFMKSDSYRRLMKTEDLRDKIMNACFRGLKRKRDE